MPPAEFYGLAEDDVIDRLEAGETITSIAADLGKVRSMLSKWLMADAKRSARARDARRLAAQSWDEKAERGLQEATDPFQLAKAKELGYHYRWRSSKADPSSYGDKVETTIKGTLAVESIRRTVFDPRIDLRIDPQTVIEK